MRVAVAGLGFMGSTHIRALQSIPGAELVAVCSRDEKKLAGDLSAVQGNLGGPGEQLDFSKVARYRDIRPVLEDSKVDAVDLCLPTHMHAAAAIQAVEAGKHVLVEKPMALTEDECQSLIAAVHETGCLLAVGFNRRFAPYYLDLKKALARRSGPAVLSARVNSPGISGSYWMADPAIGGAILGEACHFVDLFYWLLESEILTVSAFSLPTGVKEPVGENNLVATFRFADGSVANLTYCTVGSKTSGGEIVEVFAQGIGASTEDFKTFTLSAGTRHRHSTLWAEKGYKAQLEAFVSSIRDGQPRAATEVDGTRSTLGCLRMLESARILAACDIGLDALCQP